MKKNEAMILQAATDVIEGTVGEAFYEGNIDRHGYIKLYDLIQKCVVSGVKKGIQGNMVLTPFSQIPTLELGDGTTIICDIHARDEFSGVSFHVGKGEVGQDHTAEVAGKTDAEVNAFLRIITDNPKSIDVLIDKLQKARAELEKSQ